MKVTEPVLLNATQAAAYLGVSRKTFWELDAWIDRGAGKDAEA